MSRRKIPATMTSRICSGHKAFSLVRFFDAYQRNELGREADETLLISPFSDVLRQNVQEQEQRLSPSATSFLLMSVKRNGSKERRFPDRADPAIHRWRDFSTRHPCLVEKRCTSMCSALRVCELARRRWDLQKLKTTNHQPPTHRLGWLHQP